MVQDFKDFWNKPFSADMSVVGWFLLIGMLLTMCIFWNMVLRHVFME